MRNYTVYKRQKTFIKKEKLKVYKNNMTYRMRRLINAENIIITTLLLLFLGITVRAWGFSLETKFLWVAIFLLLLVSSMFLLDKKETIGWEFSIIFILFVISIMFEGRLLSQILFIFCSCLFLTIFIVKQQEQKINQIIDSVKDFTEALFGEFYRTIVLIGTFVFAIAFYPFASNWTEIAYIIMLILVEIILCLLVKNKEKIASGRIDIIAALLLFTITILILAIYYLGFIEIVFIAIGLSFLLYSITKIVSTRDD